MPMPGRLSRRLAARVMDTKHGEVLNSAGFYWAVLGSAGFTGRFLGPISPQRPDCPGELWIRLRCNSYALLHVLRALRRRRRRRRCVLIVVFLVLFYVDISHLQLKPLCGWSTLFIHKIKSIGLMCNTIQKRKNYNKHIYQMNL